MGRRLICGRRNAEVPLKYLGKMFLGLGISNHQCPVCNLAQPCPIHDDITVPGLL